MRLLIKLASTKDAAYDLKYYHKLRGFLYGLQKGSEMFNKHVEKGYKFFSFSNIFPPVDMKRGDSRTLIISSPYKDFIYYLRGRLEEMKDMRRKMNIGEMQFDIGSMKTFRPSIQRSMRLQSGTPIIIRIPKYKYAEYGLKSEKPYLCWKPGIDFNIFLKQLTENILKKYNAFHNSSLSLPIFQSFKLNKRELCLHHVEKGKEIRSIGTSWSFEFHNLTHEQMNVIELGMETGFGELNSSGFGFINEVRDKNAA